MKRIATAALAICLLSGTSALAQPGQNHQNNNNNSNNNGAHTNATKGPPPGQPQGHPQGQPQVHTFQNNQTVQTFQQHNKNNNNNQHIYNNNQQTFSYHHNYNNNNSNNNNSNNNNSRFRPNFGAPGYNPGGRRPQYSQQFFPHVFHPNQRFEWRGSRWFGPPGFYYRPYYYGQFFPLAWLAEQFWIDDYYYYDLPVPPYGYEWVRNGPDALLVDVSNGMVVEVVPGIFY